MSDLQTAFADVLGGDQPSTGTDVDPSTLRFVRFLEDHELAPNAAPPREPDVTATTGDALSSALKGRLLANSMQAPYGEPRMAADGERASEIDAAVPRPGMDDPNLPRSARPVESSTIGGLREALQPDNVPLPPPRPTGLGDGDAQADSVPMPRPRPTGLGVDAQAQAPAPAAPGDNGGFIGALRSLFSGNNASVPDGGRGAPSAPNTNQGMTLANAIRDIMVGASGPANPSKVGSFISGGAGQYLAGESREAAARKGELDRRKQTELTDWRNRSLDVRQQHDQDAADRSQFDYLPGSGPDEDGKLVPGIWTINKRTGAKEFDPGGTITGRNAASARPPAVSRIADDFIAAREEARKTNPELPPLSREDALKRAQGAPRDQQDIATRERLAASAAKSEQQAHIANPETKTEPFDMKGSVSKWRKYYGLGEPGQKEARPTAPAAPRTEAPVTDIDAEGSIEAARQAIKRDPTKRKEVIDYLKQNKITPPGDL